MTMEAPDALGLRPDMVPPAGYELGAEEEVTLSNLFLEDAPEDRLHFAAPDVQSMNGSNAVIRGRQMAILQLGNDKENDNTQFVIFKTTRTNEDDERFFVKPVNTGDMRFETIAQIDALEDGVLGRATTFNGNKPSLVDGYMPFLDGPEGHDTVSRKHVRLGINEEGQVTIQNLKPTNKTKILPITRDAPREVIDPLEMQATRAIDPATGKSVAGPSMLDARDPGSREAEELEAQNNEQRRQEDQRRKAGRMLLARTADGRTVRVRR